MISLAAVPAYFLARRVVGTWWSLAAAVLAVAIPSMVYTATLMTENAFYPVFSACLSASSPGSTGRRCDEHGRR